jgi:hypothetical protein
MKTIDYTNKSLGMSLSPDYSEQVQLGVNERMTALIKAMNIDPAKILILHGCVMTVAGSDYSMTAGSAYFNGKIYTVEAYPVTTASGGDVPVWKESKTYTKQAQYGDSALRDTFYEEKLILEMDTTGSGLADWDETEKARTLNTEIKTGSLLIGDFTYGASGINYANYQFQIIRGMLHMTMFLDFTATTSNVVDFILPDGLKAVDSDIPNGGWVQYFFSHAPNYKLHSISIHNDLNKLRIHRDHISDYVDNSLNFTISLPVTE